MQGALSEVHDQLGQRREQLATAAGTLKKDLSRLKQQNSSNMKHVPREEDTNKRKGHVNREQMCEGAEQAMARGTSSAKLTRYNSEEESNNYVMDDSQ